MLIGFTDKESKAQRGGRACQRVRAQAHENSQDFTYFKSAL